MGMMGDGSGGMGGGMEGWVGGWRNSLCTRSSLHLTTTLTCIHYNGTQTHFHHLTRPATSTISKAPAKPTKGSKAAGEGSENKKRHCKVCKEMYSSYIYKALKQVHVVHLDAGISNKTMAILNSFVDNIFIHHLIMGDLDCSSSDPPW